MCRNPVRMIPKHCPDVTGMSVRMRPKYADFDRNPRNEFDVNAIEAKNEKAEVTGHLPRRHSAFLAQLLDEGLIFIKGTAGKPEARNEIPVTLEVYVTAKGQAILTPDVADNDKYLVHAIIAAFFKDCLQYSSETVLNMANRFKALTRENVQPQSVLLSRLLHWKSKEIAKSEEGRFHELLKARLQSLQLGNVLSYRNLQVVPLFLDQAAVGYLATGDYILLKEALAAETFDITEVSESGNVPRLKVHNRGSKSVLILAGDELVGAKQNRIVNITIVIQAMSQVIIPVSCVEQNRWSYKSEKFSAGRRANAGLRSKLSRAVRESVRERGEYDGNQGMVWEEVAFMHSSLGTDSPTAAMHDAYAGVEDRLGEYAECIKYQKGAVGLLVLVNGRLMLMEAFDSPEVLEKLWLSLIESYTVDALMAETEPSADDTVTSYEKQYDEFREHIKKNLETPLKAPGAGFDVGIDGEDISGFAFFNSGRLLHLSVMTEKTDRDSSRPIYDEVSN